MNYTIAWLVIAVAGLLGSGFLFLLTRNIRSSASATSSSSRLRSSDPVATSPMPFLYLIDFAARFGPLDWSSLAGGRFKAQQNCTQTQTA